MGGTDDIANLAAVCTGGSTDHHQMLIPHGPWHLTGNPNLPDGLHLTHTRQPDQADKGQLQVWRHRDGSGRPLLLASHGARGR